MPAKDGDTVKVEYEGTFEDGEVFDTSKNLGCPLEFELGAQQIIPGFEKAVIGMKEGDEKEIKIAPEDAYGEYNSDMMQDIPRDQLPDGVEEGSMLIMGLPDGAEMPVKVAKLDKKTASMDLNHPLAGKVLNFKIKLVEISS